MSRGPLPSSFRTLVSSVAMAMAVAHAPQAAAKDSLAEFIWNLTGVARTVSEHEREINALDRRVDKLEKQKPGKEGPMGPQGPVGPQGTVGPKGDQGIAGPKGDQGIQGVAGPKGDQGIQGVAGPKGDQGIQGVAGPKGDQGIQGEPGPQGPEGQRGFAGMAGDPGATGPMGLTGPAGPAGPRGSEGAQGPMGPAGPAADSPQGGGALVNVEIQGPSIQEHLFAFFPRANGGLEFEVHTVDGDGHAGGGGSFIDSHVAGDPRMSVYAIEYGPIVDSHSQKAIERDLKALLRWRHDYELGIIPARDVQRTVTLTFEDQGSIVQRSIILKDAVPAALEIVKYSNGIFVRVEFAAIDVTFVTE